MPRSSKITFLSFAIVTVFVFLAFMHIFNQHASSQSSQSLASPPQLEYIKILNPVPFQNVDIKKELVVTGESSDNSTKDCRAYVIVNSIQPYQSAVATGPGGTTDYSQWEFVLHNQYTHLNEGNNKVTAKLQCDTAPTRWYSVTVSAVPSSNVSQTVTPEITQQGSNASQAQSQTVTPEPSEQQLLLTISSLKNPLARGDRQDTTITVTDSNNMTIANAQINGKLIYPGNNFEKEFNGITDIDGKFVFSWIVGKKGDVGPLLIEVEASSQGYLPVTAHGSFEIVESDQSSKILDPFQSNTQTP